MFIKHQNKILLRKVQTVRDEDLLNGFYSVQYTTIPGPTKLPPYQDKYSIIVSDL